MGIQIHSAAEHRTVVAIIQAGAIGKVKEVHSLERQAVGRHEPAAGPDGPGPAGLDWDVWLGVAAERPFIGGGYYHPGNWRKRLDFGTGTFGDMGCHILDPVFGALASDNPHDRPVRRRRRPNDDNWGLDVQVEVRVPRHEVHDRRRLTLTWYNGNAPPAGRGAASWSGGES